jgi:MoxR-like ATPase
MVHSAGSAMNPAELRTFLDTLVRHGVQQSLMIWGPPGIGKSSIVAQTAAAHGLAWIDLRLSQLAPTDLRGLPVARDGRARWFPPEFLPSEGRGILFLDEINMAPPTMQGMAQQLILDRRVGSYSVPEGWFIWAAGNRDEDAAAVFEMPAPLANRFLHVEVSADLESFKAFALDAGLSEAMVAFLAFRPALLHRFEAAQPAWPSPRSWAMADLLHRIGLDVSAAVGPAAAAEFRAYQTVYADLPDLEAVLAGRGATLRFPGEPSLRYAVTVGLAARASSAEQGYHALRWLMRVAGPEWVQLCAADMLRQLRKRGAFAGLLELLEADELAQAWLAEHAL